MKRIGCLVIVSIALMGCSKSDDNVVQGYIEGELQYVSANQAGYLSEMNVARGDEVTVEQALFTMDTVPQQASLAEATADLSQQISTLNDMKLGERADEIDEIKAEIAGTKATLDYYTKQEARYKALAKADASSKADYDEAVYQHDVSAANLAELQASLRLAGLGQRDNQIKAQQAAVAAAAAEVTSAGWNEAQQTQQAIQSGSVFDTYYWPGEWVAAGQPVLSLLLPGRINVIFYVPETKLAQLKVGRHVKFQCDQCQQTTTATVSYIANEAEYTPPVIYSNDMRDKLVYEVRASISPNIAANFHPGQPVDVYLQGP